jgi:hypothetical protein
MIYSQKQLAHVLLPVTYVDNDNYEYINRDTAENDYIHPSDPNYNLIGWGIHSATVQDTINVTNKLYTQMTDIMLNGDDWDDQDEALRRLFVQHGTIITRKNSHLCYLT